MATPGEGPSVDHPEFEGLPDQAPPQEGSVFDSRPFWSGGGRGTRRRSGDGAGGSGGTSSRWRRSDPSRPRRGTTRRNSEAAERRTASARRHFLPMPQETIGRHLGAGEVVLLSDSPAWKWFVASNLLWFFGLAALVAGIFVSLLEGWGWAALACFLGVLVVGAILYTLRLTERYTSYVITNARMVRMSGVVSLKVESIPWVRVTDTSFTQDFLERLIGTYTVNIESANETAGLRRMRGIAQHEDFERHMTDMIVAKQGATVPLGRRSDYSVMPPDRSYRGFRGRERDRRKAKGFREESTFEHEGAAGATATKVEDATDVGAVVGDEPTVEAPVPTPAAEPAARRRPDPVEADPALPEDLSNMESVSDKQMAADRKRQDRMLGRDVPPDP